MLKQHKIVSALPGVLDADSVYYIRTGSGFDTYVTNSLGMVVAYTDNAKTLAASAQASADAAAQAAGTKEPAITAGTSAQFWSGTKAWVDFGNTVRAAVLTGVVFTTSTAIAATDTLLAALGKLQAQITNRALKGANSDITSLSGLTTALSIAQGGTGQKTAADALNALGGVPSSALGVSVAQLVNGVVPAAQLPSYVDDVLEFTNFAGFPATGETGKIYVALDTNRQYRWSGSAYVQLVASPGTTDNVPEGTTNLYHTLARVLGTLLTGLSTGDSSNVAATDTLLAALGKLQAQLSLKAALASPTFTGTPLVPTAPVATNNTQAASTAYVRAYADTVLGFGSVGVGPGLADMNDATAPSASYYVNASTINSPESLTGSLLHKIYGTAGYSLFFPSTANRIMYRRRASGAWQGWRDLAFTDSPAFTGTPSVPTAPAGTKTTQIASTEFVENRVLAAGGGAKLPIATLPDVVQTTANSTADFDILTLTTTADLLQGAMFEARLFGTQSQSAAAQNLTLYAKINGGTAVTIGTVGTGSSAQSYRAFSGRAMLTFPTVGASGSYLLGGDLAVSGLAAFSSNSASPRAASTLTGMTITIGVRMSVANAANFNNITGAYIRQLA